MLMRNSHIEGRKNVYIHKILSAFLVPDKKQRHNPIHRPSLLEKTLYKIWRRSEPCVASLAQIAFGNFFHPQDVI